MLRKIRVLFSWTKMKAMDVVSFAKNVVLEMKANSGIFAKPAVALDELDKAASDLASTYPLRKNGATAKNNYDAALTKLDDMLHVQADFVNLIAKGDKGIILQSGFEPSSEISTPTAVPASPATVELTPEKGGILHLFIKKITGASSYVYVVFLGVDYFPIAVDGYLLVMPAGSTIRTIIIPDGATKETITGLTPGMQVYVQALAQNHAGKSAFCGLSNTFII